MGVFSLVSSSWQVSDQQMVAVGEGSENRDGDEQGLSL